MGAEKLLSVARSQLGVKESPANSNNVKYNTWYYGRSVYGSAYPWCMAFVQWCFNEAGMRLPKITASCGALLNWYRANDPGCVVAEPKPGDIVIFDFPGTKYSTDHTGILENATKSSVTTIDGNTGTTSDANGGAVMRRTRARSTVAAFIRPRSLWPKPEKQEETKQEERDVGFNVLQLTDEDCYAILQKAQNYAWKLEVPEGASFVKDVVNYAVEKGISDGSRPLAYATRYEAMGMALNALEKAEGKHE